MGLYSSRGYIISPSLVEERRRYNNDPVESEESDIDEEDLANMDHAPNWANGPEADKKQGLRFTSRPEVADTGEECKLVLVVRTDLGMTKGKCALLLVAPSCGMMEDKLTKMDHRQDCSSMRACNPRLLQSHLQSRLKFTSSCRTSPSLGESRPGQDRSPKQVARRDPRTAQTSASLGRHR